VCPLCVTSGRVALPAELEECLVPCVQVGEATLPAELEECLPLANEQMMRCCLPTALVSGGFR
jgi:hypothetical protein